MTFPTPGTRATFFCRPGRRRKGGDKGTSNPARDCRRDPKHRTGKRALIAPHPMHQGGVEL